MTQTNDRIKEIDVQLQPLVEEISKLESSIVFAKPDELGEIIEHLEELQDKWKELYNEKTLLEIGAEPEEELPPQFGPYHHDC